MEFFPRHFSVKNGFLPMEEMKFFPERNVFLPREQMECFLRRNGFLPIAFWGRNGVLSGKNSRNFSGRNLFLLDKKCISSQGREISREEVYFFPVKKCISYLEEIDFVPRNCSGRTRFLQRKKCSSYRIYFLRGTQ